MTLVGAWNFRDVASSTHGAVVPGLLFRSGELSMLEEAGQAQLDALGIADIADLRSPTEVQNHGADRVSDAVTVHALPFLDHVDDSGNAPHENAFAQLMAERPAEESASAAGHRYMVAEYERFVTAPGSQRAVRQLAALLSAGHPVLTHCFAGKDRTGFAVAVVLQAAGVDQDAVMADYLASNEAVPQLREQIKARINLRFGGQIPDEVREITNTQLSDEILGVRTDFLDSALGLVQAQYGSATAYLQSSGITDQQLSALRNVLRG